MNRNWVLRKWDGVVEEGKHQKAHLGPEYKHSLLEGCSKLVSSHGTAGL